MSPPLSGRNSNEMAEASRLRIRQGSYALAQRRDASATLIEEHLTPNLDLDPDLYLYLYLYLDLDLDQGKQPCSGNQTVIEHVDPSCHTSVHT